jgi:lipopolysaccharide/colanic/teichoic acid biosynthesis glycosyltransferase
MLKSDQLVMPGGNGVVPELPLAHNQEAAPRFPLWKRVLDIICVLLALPVLVPAGILIALYIKTVSPGPAFFRQRRVGHFGKPFLCLKFRTMKVNADTTVHQAHLKELMTSNRPTRKLDCAGDDRLIPGGLLLRATCVDELPQFFNVLRGDMSLVGPRPCTVYEYALYSPRHQRRCEAPPGLTGLWQVSGKNSTTFEEQINLDLDYARRMSLWLDLKIIGLTIPAVVALVWEMKRSRKAGASGTMPAAERPAVEEEKEPGRFHGTVAARE